MTKLYVVRDILAGAVVGPVQSFKHDAVAVRFFGDVAQQQGTSINLHIDQHELLCVAEMDEETGETSGYKEGPRVVLTGAAWNAMQDPQEAAK